jgi:hypothetical protein
MAFPATCTLTGSFFDASGNGARGQITFTPNAELVDASGAVILPQIPIVAQIVNGVFTVHLIPTDTAGVTPTNWSYAVTEQILLDQNKPYTTYVTYYIQPTGTGTVNLASLAQYEVAPTVIAYGGLSTNNTWTGTNTFNAEVIVPTPVNSTDAATKAYVDSHAGTNAYTFDVTSASYGAKGDGQFVLDGAMSSASAVLTSASGKFVSTDVGKVIMVKGAGATGVQTLVTTIASYQSATQVTLTLANASGGAVSGALVMWATDDTAAIQAAVNAALTYATAHGSAVVSVPIGSGLFYGIGGALKTGSPTLGNAQITLGAPVATSANKVCLTIEGVGNGAGLQHWQQNNPQLNGSTLVSFGAFASPSAQTTNINANGNPSVIGGPTQTNGYGTSGSVFDNKLITLRNLSILTTHTRDGIGYTAADFSGVAEANLENFAYGTTGSVAANDYQTPSNFAAGLVIGLLMPASGNNDNNRAQNVSCHGGYTFGIFATEHFVCDRLCVLYCWSGLCPVGSYFSSVGATHAITIQQASIEACTNVMNIVGAGSSGIGPWIFTNIDTEIAGPTFTDRNNGVALNAALGTVVLTGLYTPSSVNVTAPTGLNIVNGQQGSPARVVSGTASYSVLVIDRTILVDASAQSTTINLISAAWTPNVITVLRLDSSANTLHITANGTELINGVSTISLTGQYSKVTLTPARVSSVWGWYETA